jgi:uncharacterized protein (TIGR02231 family)
MSNPRRVVLCILAAAVLAGAVAYAQEVPPPRFVTPNPELKIQAVSRIQSVTVFADRATVVRTAAIRPIPGPQSVVFSGLPTSIIGGSLRAGGRGTAEVKILGLETANEYLDSPLLPEAKRVQTELDALLYEIGKTKNDMAVLGVQESFLMSLPASQSVLNAASVAQGKADPLGWEKTLEFLGGKLATVKAGQLDRQKTLKEQEAKAESLRKRIEDLKPGRPAEARKVTVLIEAKSPGDFALDLSYTVANARWSPVYVVRALPDSGEAELALSAVIQQRSGESWEGVRMALSTSSPALESRPRELSPWILDIYVPRMAKSSSRDDGSARMMMAEMPSAVPPPPPSPAPREAEVETASVAETGLHVNFEIKRSVDVPSDGAPHKFPIDAPTVKVKYDYAAVPQTREAAYLRGTLTNTLAYPLLAGGADLFIGQDFVGAMTLPATAAGEEAKFFFGEDGQIKVKTEQIKREKIGAAFLSKTEKLHLVYRLTVQNLRKTAVSVDVTDRLPVSQNSKIEVKDVVLTPATAKKAENGLLSWTVLLAPQEKKEILIEYTIEYPKDAIINGL